jgi:hypothetical protein
MEALSQWHVLRNVSCCDEGVKPCRRPGPGPGALCPGPPVADFQFRLLFSWPSPSLASAHPVMMTDSQPLGAGSLSPSSQAIFSSPAPSQGSRYRGGRFPELTTRVVAGRRKPSASSLERRPREGMPGTEPGDSVFGGGIAKAMQGPPGIGGRSRLRGHETPQDPHPGEPEP